MMTDVMREYGKIMEAKTVAEAYDAQMEAYNNLSEKDGDKLFDLLCEADKRISPETVHMGINTTKGDPDWENLKNKIRKIVERDGICRASWSCEGRTRHQWQSEVLAADMPEYQFIIEYDTYKCEIRKK